MAAVTVLTAVADPMAVAGRPPVAAAHTAAMAAGHIDAHGDRLVGLVGHDHALTRLLATRAVLARRRRRLRFVGAVRARLLACASPPDAPDLGLAPALLDALGVALLGRARLTRLRP